MKTKRTDRLRGRPRTNSAAISQENTWYVAGFGVRQLSMVEFIIPGVTTVEKLKVNFSSELEPSLLRNRFLLSLFS